VADVMTKPENPNKHLLKQMQKIHYGKKTARIVADQDRVVMK
jgi:hypothetical protein